MRPKSLLLLLLALGCGLVASIGISQVMEHRNQAQTPPAEMEKIYVAKKDIRVNEPLNPQNLVLEDWPKDRVPADAVRELKELENQHAGSTILQGEPIRKGKFANDTRMNEIPPGYRVVAVPADAVSSTGHLLQPGDRVDVIVYVTRNVQAGIDQPLAKTVLQDVRVFAVNEHWRTDESKDAEAIAARTVSLLVTPDQVELVTLAAEMGRIRLVLRHPDDDKIAQTGGKDAKDLFGGDGNGDRAKEWGENKQTNSGAGGGILNFLKANKQPPAAEPKIAAAEPSPEEEQHFWMELLKGEEVSRVEFTKKGKDGRWQTETTGGGSFQGAADPTVGAPTPDDPTTGATGVTN
ncbi:MAG: Flp pilus assembly protein CpaB [Pirellulales bacterium]|nr:Flp pilus assembly protein CpaB [Pirellulales bacterium]